MLDFFNDYDKITNNLVDDNKSTSNNEEATTNTELEMLKEKFDELSTKLENITNILREGEKENDSESDLLDN